MENVGTPKGNGLGRLGLGQGVMRCLEDGKGAWWWQR